MCETMSAVDSDKIFGFYLALSIMNSGLAHSVRYLWYISFSQNDGTVFYLTLLSVAHST